MNKPERQTNCSSKTDVGDIGGWWLFAGDGVNYDSGSINYSSHTGTRVWISDLDGNGHINCEEEILLVKEAAHPLSRFTPSKVPQTFGFAAFDHAAKLHCVNPFGMPHDLPEEVNLPSLPYRDSDPFTYNNKEYEDRVTRMHDYHARWYDAALGEACPERLVEGWSVVDPLAEKYYSISPYAYVANNPIIFIDPDSKQITVRRVERENQNDLVTIKFTADIVNTSDANLSKDQLNSIGDIIGGQIIESFGESFSEFDVEVSVSLNPIASLSEISDDHLIRIVDPDDPDLTRTEGGVGASNILGSTAKISSSIVGDESQLARTGAHEFGHLAGLYHPDDPRNSMIAPEANLDRTNLMHQSGRSSGTNIIQRQVEAILDNFKY